MQYPFFNISKLIYYSLYYC